MVMRIVAMPPAQTDDYILQRATGCPRNDDAGKRMSNRLVRKLRLAVLLACYWEEVKERV